MNHRLLLLILVLLLTGCPPGASQRQPPAAWQRVDGDSDFVPATYRTTTPDGWLIVTSTGATCSVRDIDHLWLPDLAPTSPTTEVEKR